MLAMRIACVLSVIFASAWAGPRPTPATASAFHARHGAYRTYYPSGALYQVQHYVDGREEGLQQAWTEDGELYLNYDVRNGRRYGFVNAKPCAPVEAAEEER